MTTTGPTVRYRPLPAEQGWSALEEGLLARWEEEQLFARVQAARADGEPWVFFEGPPTANGRPGIHHVFSRTLKDLFCRHRAMRGHFVRRKAGWDTHGLPVEIEVEKSLGISGKQDIERIGVREFNRLCRESVWKYLGEWERLSQRMGYWLDYSEPYVTYTRPYMESVWWALRTLYDRGLLYKGHKILPYCPRCGTALSSHELAQGYADVSDPSVYVALALVDGEGSAERGQRILVWTTTPWTLVSNTALAVHPGLPYVELRRRGRDEGTLILAEARVAAVLGEDHADRWDEVARHVGSELVGRRYRRPLDWVEYGPGEHEVIVGEEFVSATDGSGVVHMAPAFGADDYAAGQRHGLAFVLPVDGRGQFPADMPVVGGRFVKDADPLIIEELKRRGVLWKAGVLEHPYPHCWRCGTPLIYYARTSWFVRTTAYRDEMLARNARVDWHPGEMGRGRFGEWLTNNVDWAISRDRYWGTPLPVWVCDRDDAHVDVVGSFDELSDRSQYTLGRNFDPHKPFIDEYHWPCSRCAEAGAEEPGRMRRVPEVIDTWFDSGAMPFAQWHYPFENREMLAAQYPADFIAEGVDQTRGWFYSLLAIAAGLGDALPNNESALAPASRAGRPSARRAASASPTATASAPATASRRTAPYRAVVVNDLVLDAQGVKMSKSRGNVVDPMEVMGRHGADAVRLFLVASSQVWVPRRFDEQAIRQTVTSFLVTLRNVYSFFALYANFGWEPTRADPPRASRPAADRWILSRTATVAREVDAALGRFDATEAARLLMGFVVDDLSNWYVRLNRRRYYDVESDDSLAAFATLHDVLTCTCRLLAPFAPFLPDWIHRELTGGSVHLARYDCADGLPADAALEQAMEEIRALAKLGRAAREDVGINVRQPLAEVVCVVPTRGGGAAYGTVLSALVPLLSAELNVKQVTFASSSDALVTLEARPNFRSLGKKFGKQTPLAAQAVAALGSDALRAFERGEPLSVSVGEESRQLDADDVTIVRRAAGALVVREEGGRFAAVDPAVTPELRREGLARELVNRVQRMRKDAGFAVSDRIRLHVGGNEELLAAVRTHREWVGSEVLALEVGIEGEGESHRAAQVVDLDGVEARIAITRDT